MGLQYVKPAPVRRRLPDTFPESPVEGPPPSPAVLRLEGRVLAAAIIIAFVAAVFVGYSLDGARGVVVGLTVFAFYFLLGWWPYFAARHYRRITHEDEP